MPDRRAVNASVPEIALEHEDGSPARVLLIARDRRFRMMAAALLGRRGHPVQVGRRLFGLARQARQAQADVVVLEMGSWPVAGILEYAWQQTLDPGVGLVLVADGFEEPTPPAPLVDRWGSLEGLCEAIEQARPVARRHGQLDDG